jgi:gliding motility-associated-like protein
MLDVGLDTIYLTNSSNCDSLIITNKIFSPGDTLYTSATTCEVVLAGMDTLFLLNANNCDSLVITNTIFSSGDTLFNEVTTCDVAQVGMDTLFLSNANNCDSLVITNTIFSSGDTLFNEVTTCDVAQVGMDTLFLSNANNCDSLVITNTVFSAGDTLFNAVPTCDESEVSLDTQYLLNSNNCDSLVITSTFLVQNDTILITDYSCDIEQAEYSNIIIPGPVCDTVVLMELLPLESDMIVLEYTTCKIAEEGVISENYTNQSGCDSIVISNFVYVPLDTFYVATETCFIEELQQDTVVVLGDDCDSIFVYSTILLEGNQTTIETFICDPENAQMDTNYYQNQNGCDSLVITSYEFNPIAFEWVQTYDPCDDSQERSIQIINPQGNTQPFIFSINGNDFYDLTEFSMLDSGTYLIYAQDTNGCISEPVEVIFDFHAPLVTNLPSNLTINLETSQQIFLEFSAEPDTFYWDDENLVSCTSCLDPFILADQDVALTLFYTNDYGCLFSDTIDIKVEEELNDFFIPNVFSPNGDNANDLFHLFTNDPSATLELCEIYDRWGNKFYQNYDPNLKELKWDGKFNGSEAATGVYLYRIVLLNSKGDRIYLIGDVTLVR